MIVDGYIAYAPSGNAERQRLGRRLVRLLNMHTRYATSALLITRCNGVELAIDALKARIAMMDDERMAA